MKIPNPWPHHNMFKCTCKCPRGEYVSVQGVRGVELEVDDDVTEVLIEAVRFGSASAPPLWQGQLWSIKWGLNSLEDHLSKMHFEEEKAKLEAEKERMVARKVEKAKKARKPAKSRVVDDKMELGGELEL